MGFEKDPQSFNDKRAGGIEECEGLIAGYREIGEKIPVQL